MFLCCLVGIIYDSTVTRIDVVSIILLEVKNISLDTNLVIYINSTITIPIIIKNRIYENQNLLCIFPPIKYTIVVCINNIIPMVSGCLIYVNIHFVIALY
jgi:hypothetical protein